MKTVLDAFVSKEQLGFVPNRNIAEAPWFTQDQLDAMRRERTVLPSYKRRRTDDESDPTVPWSPQYVEHLTNVKTKFVYEHLNYCTCPQRSGARAEHHLNCNFSRLYRHFDDPPRGAKTHIPHPTSTY